MYEISLRKMKVFALLFALLAASCSALRVVRLPTRTHRATSKLDAQFQTTQNCARPSAPRNALTAPSPPTGPVGVDGVDAPRRRCRRAPAARCAARRLRGREHLLDQTHEDGEEVGPRLREGAPRRCDLGCSRNSQFAIAQLTPLLPVRAPQNGCNVLKECAKGAALPFSDEKSGRPVPYVNNCWTSGGKKGKCG